MAGALNELESAAELSRLTTQLTELRTTHAHEVHRLSTERDAAKGLLREVRGVKVEMRGINNAWTDMRLETESTPESWLARRDAVVGGGT